MLSISNTSSYKFVSNISELKKKFNVYFVIVAKIINIYFLVSRLLCYIHNILCMFSTFFRRI